MKSHELTLALDGEVTADEFAASAAFFARLVKALTQEAAASAAIAWRVTSLRGGSSQETLEPVALEPAARPLLSKIVIGAERFGEAMQARMMGAAPLPIRSRQIRALAAEAPKLRTGKIIRMRLETPRSDFILAGAPEDRDARAEFEAPCFGSVVGSVQTITSHGSLRFTLYDLVDQRAVSCYLADDKNAEKKMRNLWGKTVEVEGMVRRDSRTGRALTVREIDNVEQLRAAKYTWRDAIGAAPGFLGNDRSEDIIRDARDA